MATQGGLNVVALVSGGKDSFFSLLHCQANGHRVVALANLYPPETTQASSTASTSSATSRQHSSPAGHEDHDHGPASGPVDEIDSEADLNSFMYQTVGHQAIPLYATATGLPLFRQPIAGTMVQSGISYSSPQQPSSSSTAPTRAAAAGAAPTDSSSGSVPGGGTNPHGHGSDLEDETESLVPLLRAVIAAHPEVNAVCTGAILSTYQRTRIESVALRLGLVPLAYLWQYPALPIPAPTSPASASADLLSTVVARGHTGSDDDAQLLRDMASAGLEARIVKVASAGLDEDFLWSNVASDDSIKRIKRALRRFGGGGRGSVLGEGGEFETIVVNGPPALFKSKIEISDVDRRVVREGGGSTWLSIRNAHVQEKTDSTETGGLPNVRIPDQLDPRFQHILDTFTTDSLPLHEDRSEAIQRMPGISLTNSLATLQHEFIGIGDNIYVEQQTIKLVDDIRDQVDPRLILNTVIVLRQMSDFPTINKIYGGLFPEPNPPSRVTISCGSLLPEGSKIAIFATSQPGPAPSVRRGLHVQSRSYWAPANIGPYSQAIVFPQGAPRGDSAVSDGTGGPQVVTIAGQIPLIPASMDLPQSHDSVPFQITLALQHLWRVGVELQSQWWTSAVAYFPRTPASEDMKLKATLAARAWNSAHTWSIGGSDDEEEDESGPDLWDRRFNPEYMSLVGADDTEATPTLPKWETLNCYDEDDDAAARAQRPVPYMFAVEVDELPRSAGVEWHAHRGLVNVSPGSVHVVNSTLAVEGSSARVELQHVVANSAKEIYVHTVAAMSHDPAQSTVGLEGMIEVVNGLVNTSIKAALESFSELQFDLMPYLVYVDAQRNPDLEKASHNKGCQAIVPCFSVWDSRGQGLDVAMVYQAHFTKSR
ncbi:hypothetical protein PFICI_01826 [Pestalotiopsis fici W106-1]|uniref:Diphthine--ammonia ligase n=1 Tax=Pestalotiopsis fici (strain W106-1 / CGMCC3.15140) TaxID=1229662 RepID=W3XPL2_PESFW|nr:uncharacterized protein PFICI_01826 [Pestalotiopsis fici W106-1]ETS87998.1 hypothetical protein PFICI_01826 [Pestalotiopsis fici W106-1]